MAFNGGGAMAGISFGTWRSIPVHVHWSFFAIWAIQVIFALFQSFKYALVMFFLFGPILFFSVLLHEFGHILTNRLCGGTCESITLWPFGGLSKLVLPDGSPMDEIKISASGPLMHIPSIIFWVIIMVISAPDRQGLSYEFDMATFKSGGAGEWFAALSQQAYSTNILLLALNLLLPVYPLDAARILAAACVQCGATIVGAAYVVAIAGVALGLGLLGYGIGMFASGGASAFTYFFLGILALFASGQLMWTLRMQMAHKHPLFAPECYHNAEMREKNRENAEWVDDRPEPREPPPIQSIEFDNDPEDPKPPEQPKKKGNGSNKKSAGKNAKGKKSGNKNSGGK